MTHRIPILLLAILPTFTVHANETAREIMQKQKEVHRVPEERTRFSMILKDKRGRERERSLTIDSRTRDSGLDRIRLQFDEPSDIRGVALLTWEQAADEEDDQWLYLPARRASKRITSSGKKNSFMGTDLAFEDLRPENLPAHGYKIVREEEHDGIPCWVIQATPATDKEEKDSGYSKRLLWIRQDIYFTIKVHYFDRRGNHLKTLHNRDLIEIDSGRWRSNESITTSLSHGSSTIMRAAERSLNPQFPDSHFEPDALGR